MILHRMLCRLAAGPGEILLLACALAPGLNAHADEGGGSFWLPGQVASMAAVPPAPGWSLNLMPYYYSGRMEESRILPQGLILSNRNATQSAQLSVQPGYAPETKILGGQAFFGLGFGAGSDRAQVDATVSFASMTTQSNTSDSKIGGTDLSPVASLAWNDGVHNWITYLTGNIPVGAYNSQRLANIGIGHGAIDAGGGYTFFNPQSGHEFSAVLGITYNFENPDTDYTSGVDAHLDWDVSWMLSVDWQIGLAGYVYYQLGADRYPAAGALLSQVLGDYRSRVIAIGPELGYTFNFNGAQGSLNVRGYWEFWAQNRPEGYALFATLGIPFGG